MSVSCELRLIARGAGQPVVTPTSGLQKSLTEKRGPVFDRTGLRTNDGQNGKNRIGEVLATNRELLNRLYLLEPH